MTKKGIHFKIKFYFLNSEGAKKIKAAKSFCPQGPKIQNLKPDTRTGKVYTKIWFNTYSLPCFNELYDTFYPNGVKIVPQNIGDLLIFLGLAYLICDDGNFSKSHQAVRISTNSGAPAHPTADGTGGAPELGAH